MFVHTIRLEGMWGKAGELFADIFQLNDHIFDIENKAMTNRPECFGLIGLAREIAGVQKLPFETPEWFDYGYGVSDDMRKLYSGLVKKDGKLTSKVCISNDAPDLVNRYMAVVIDNITIGESPLWLQLELMKAGMRPLNNVIDITNYLMIQTGQPIHAFDADKLVKKDHNASQKDIKIVTRKSKKGETLITLDGKSHELDGEILVIADSSSPIAIAGVMGGLDTGIDENTRRIVIEVANFSMYSIRKTANKLGLFTDAFTRFSKNQDPQMCEPVIYKAIEMYCDLADGKVVSEIVDDYPNPRKVRQLKIKAEDINRSVGLDLPVEDIKQLLENVELKTDLVDGTFEIQIPTYRQDLNIPEDIYEEVARLYGFRNIPMRLPERLVAPVSRNPVLELQNRVRHVLASFGAYEILTYNFVGQKLLEKCNLDVKKAFHVKNSLSPELEYMRTSLIPSILEKVKVNQDQGHEKFALFEINKSHLKGVMDKENLPYELRTVSCVYSAVDKISQDRYAGSPYYQAKKYVNELLSQLKSSNVSYERVDEIDQKKLPVWVVNSITQYDGNESAIITYKMHNKKYYLGVIGTVCSHTITQMNLPKYTAGFELNIEDLLNIVDLGSSYTEPSKYPKVIQDLCFVLDDDVPYKVLEGLIMSDLNKPGLMGTVEPIDIYKQDAEGSGEQESKQVTIRINLQSQENVLSERAIEDWRKRVIRKVRRECGGKLKELEIGN